MGIPGGVLFHSSLTEVPATSTCSSSPSAHSACLQAPTPPQAENLDENAVFPPELLPFSSG